mmetsp:Transcript_8310/g.18901  ORF Transcript_8310/g.18901 Transcript_8310/m.18901 type:complete len:134 (-) Transcript_8310:104-505(-)
MQGGMFEVAVKLQQLLTDCAPGMHHNESMRGIGVTCYSHNGKDLYCNKPAEGTCWTTGGWCPPADENDEILSKQGVTAFCGLTPLNFSGSVYAVANAASSASASGDASSTASGAAPGAAADPAASSAPATTPA